MEDEILRLNNLLSESEQREIKLERELGNISKNQSEQKESVSQLNAELKQSHISLGEMKQRFKIFIAEILGDKTLAERKDLEFLEEFYNETKILGNINPKTKPKKQSSGKEKVVLSMDKQDPKFQEYLKSGLCKCGNKKYTRYACKDCIAVIDDWMEKGLTEKDAWLKWGEK